MERIAILKAKHGDVYYNASSEELLAAAYLAIVNFNNEDGCYYEPQLSDFIYNREYLDFINLSDDEVAALPEVFRQKVAETKENSKSAIREFEQAKLVYDEVQRVLAARPLAAHKMVTKVPGRSGEPYEMNTLRFIIDSRNDYEYEEVRIERVSSGRWGNI